MLFAQCRKFAYCLTMAFKSSLLLLVLLVPIFARDTLVGYQDNPDHSRLLRESIPNFPSETGRLINRGNEESIVSRFQPNIGSPTRSSPPTLSLLDESSDFLSTLYGSTYLHKRTQIS